MDPAADKTLVDPSGLPTMPAHGYASTVLRDPGNAVADTEAELAGDEGFGVRYETRASLGEGGMGEVHLCKDTRIGREVAIKVIRKGTGSRSDLHRRFLREARVQGQLEHPAIVPVYDLGRDSSGAAYFTMKRVHGDTLLAIVDKLRAGDADTLREYTPRKLLTAFVSVCQAVHFAHTRGVLHRDLKPANIMLGDFGEVYVLDWGLARLHSSADDSALPQVEVRGEALGKTAHGAIMGTPGYMSPEQIRGAIDELDERCDVYALGTILFELLTLESLHGGDTAERILMETLKGVDARPSARVPEREIAPELEAICVRATALKQGDRFVSARALCDAVEDYLDGDRDLVRRREIAARHATAAGEAADRALEAGDASARAAALREAGRAIVLDPNNADATRTLLRLLTEPPRELPDEARVELEQSEQRALRASMRIAAIAYTSWIFYFPFGAWMGTRGQWPFALVAEGMWFVASILCFWGYRKKTLDARVLPAFAIVSGLAVVATSVLFGSLVLLPVVAIANTVPLVMVSPPRRRIWAILVGVLTILVPFALEQLGVLPARYVFSDGALTILPFLVGYAPIPTTAFLVFSNVALVITASFFVARFRDAQHKAEERVIVHAWQLRQMTPTAAHGAVPSPHPPSGSHCALRS